MSNSLNRLPAVEGNIVDLATQDLPANEIRRLLIHDSMKVYFNVSFADENRFRLEELPTTAARAELILPILEDITSKSGKELSVLDLACSPGYFLFKLAKLGYSNLYGVDAREDHYKHFRLLQRLYGFNQIHYDHLDIYDFLDSKIQKREKFDICLLFGFLYHTCTPVELLRKIGIICSKYLIVDTTANLSDEMSITVYEERTDWSRASTTKISFMPSVSATTKIIEASGVGKVELVPPDSKWRKDNPGGDKIDYFYDHPLHRLKMYLRGILIPIFRILGLNRQKPNRRVLYKVTKEN